MIPTSMSKFLKTILEMLYR
ncbi:hypothetical protein S40285_09431 [Stachybotrys chlorohalonatus IBT 40285]|uniref:Uncharacterized protein n=1 Tax=Stachybotrys chlorohalonatus (strain IBT 40285) TaxID=1283841 RepID=A0A084R2Z8_STAC4|nr:hypothetical protein S40285_09431 [Stachybotrys chlorohalonata IBT 40285]